MKCDKHKCEMEYRDIGHGKNQLVCPKCEKERNERIKKYYSGIKSICPLCGQITKRT